MIVNHYNVQPVFDVLATRRAGTWAGVGDRHRQDPGHEVQAEHCRGGQFR